ncbi:MAG TPA: hypothetical protein DCW41_06480 [Clostridiales bacterium]|nr:hypothetical protein [Clostridiales bacterium]
MLVDPPMEEMLPRAACAYELAVLVSKRASQLVDGAQPMIPDDAANMVSLACKEIAQGKVLEVHRVLKKDEYTVPLTKEARDAIAAEKKAKEQQNSYKKAAMDADLATAQPEAAEDKALSTDNFFVVDTSETTEG